MTLPAALYPLRRASSGGPDVPLEFHGTVVEQCPRQNAMFSGLRAHALFHRFEIFFRARRAPLKKVEERG
jgi:hypothetical protein